MGRPLSTESTQFDGLVGLTLRLYRINAGPLTAVAAIATAVILLATSARAGVSLSSAFGSPLFGLNLSSGSGGAHIGLDPQLLGFGLVGVAAGAWSAATMVPMLLRHVREGQPARFADLSVGFAYLVWVLVATVLVALLEAGLIVLAFFGLPALLSLVVPLLVLEFLFSTAILLYVPLIVDGDDGPSALLASWRLVRTTGFWRLFVYVVVAELAAMVLVLIADLFAALLPNGARPLVRNSSSASSSARS